MLKRHIQIARDNLSQNKSFIYAPSIHPRSVSSLIFEKVPPCQIPLLSSSLITEVPRFLDSLLDDLLIFYVNFLVPHHDLAPGRIDPASLRLPTNFLILWITCQAHHVLDISNPISENSMRVDDGPSRAELVHCCSKSLRNIAGTKGLTPWIV